MLNLALAFLLAASPQDTDADKVGALFDRLVKSMADKDADAMNRCFHARRMMKELEVRGFGTPAATPEAADLKVQALQGALAKLATNAGAIGAAWEKIRLLRLQVGPDGTEAEAFCRMTIGGAKSRVRFWLAKEEEWWKVYDFEMQEGSLRLSILVGSVWAGMGGNEKGRKAVLGSFLALQRATAELEAGEPEKAQKIVRTALESKPPAMLLGWLEVVNAQASIALGEYEEAVKAAGRVLEHQADVHLAHLLQAQALFELQDYEKCIEAAQEYLKRSGDDVDGWELVGNAQDKLSNRKEAIAAYRKGAAADDEEFANRVSLGRLLIADGKPAEAATVLQEASKNAPADEGVFEEAAAMLDGAGEFAAVLQLARDQAKRTPDEVEAVIWEGKALRKLKRFDEAEKALLKGLEKDEEDQELAEELIFTLAQGGKDVEALKRVDKIAAEDEDRGRFLRAFVHVSSGRSGKAIEELKAMLDSYPDGVDEIEQEPAFEKLRQEVDLQILIGRAKAVREFDAAAAERMGEKDWEGLLKLARERIGLAPDHAHAHYHQGYALLRLGRPFDAELAFKAAIGKTKDKILFRDELGRALAVQGKLDEALALAEELLANHKDRTPGLHLRVVAYVMAKKLEPALKALEEVLKEDPYWHAAVEADDDLEEFRKLQACQDLLKKAKAKGDE